MKRIAGLVCMLVLLLPGVAGASTPVVGVGGSALASKVPNLIACNATIKMLVSELTEDTSPVQVRGKVKAVAEGICGPGAPVPYMTDIHIYAGGVEIHKWACPGHFLCTSAEVAFTVPAGAVLSAASDQYWDAPAGYTWNAATPGLCSIKNPRVWCGAYAAMTP
ncbi:MAG: hypothetical protein HY775_07260 [Acidobacteria bacterium]|nr:hypothetical protein [Acidobacteriota bacterium]